MSAEDASLGEAVLRISTDGNGLRLGINEAHLAAMGMQRNLDSMQDHIKDRFAEKFEHVGVHLFGHDMLQAVGITNGARPILGALSMGVSQLAESFGVASGPIGLVVFGLTALAAIGFKVYESHHKHAEGLEEVAKKQTEVRKTTTELLEKLGEYQRAVGTLTPQLKGLEDATKRLDEVQRHNLITTEALQMGADQRAILANKERIGVLNELIETSKRHDTTDKTSSGRAVDYAEIIKKSAAEIAKLNEKNIELDATFKKNESSIKAQAKGHADIADSLDKETKKLEELAKKRKEDQEHIEKASATLARMGAFTKEIEQEGAAATTNAYEKRKAEIEKYRIAKQFEIDRMHAEVLINARTQDQILAVNRQHSAANAALNDAVAKKNFENYRAIGTAATALGKTIENSFATSAARAITTSKSMHDAWVNISQQIKEQIVADGIKMGVEYVAQAAKGIIMHHSIATAAAESAAIQVKANAAVIISNQAKAASIGEITGALVAAAKAATALDVALAAAV